jgi:peptide chain release factor 1
LFAKDLLAAYVRYADKYHLRCEIVYESESFWSLRIDGEHCWDAFSGESGKHVVQRVPPTETRGRRHTSVVAVAVLPLLNEASARLPEHEVEVTTQCGHGKGGQHQNKVASAVRAVHRPTGIKVFINGRDQYRNKQTALEILEARVCQFNREQIHDERNEAKANQLGSSSRSGKVRTYNFINRTAIDHRTGKRTGRLDEVMKGNLELLK